MTPAADPYRALKAGDTMLSIVALSLATVHGGYGALILIHGKSLWALPTYDAALSFPGGQATWLVASLLAALLLLAGTVFRSEHIVGAGATASALWLSFFAAAFAISALDDTTPVALPGVIIYGGVALIAATRAALALGRP